MDELEKRRRQLADPQQDLQRLVETSAETLTQQQLAEIKSRQHFEKQLKKAMHIEAPSDLADRIIFNQRLVSRKGKLLRWSLAASFAVASLLVVFVIHQPQMPLSQAALAHVYKEIDLLTQPKNVSVDEVKKQLAALNIALPFLPQNITFAYPCGLADDKAMHLVVQIDGQPITVFIRPAPIDNASRFADDRFVGKMQTIANTGIVAIAEDPRLLDKLYQQLAGV